MEVVNEIIAETAGATAPPEGYPSAIPIPINDVVFREDLYPRLDGEQSATTVQQYAQDLDILPPIELNQYKILLDGWHRWTAHRKNGRDYIWATITETKSDVEALEIAIRRNAAFGLQLSAAAKKKQGVRLYNMDVYSSQKDREARKAYLAKLLSVSITQVKEWTSRTDKDVKKELREKAFALWLSCHTQEEIAEAVGYSDRAIRHMLKSVEDLRQNAGSGFLPGTDGSEDELEEEQEGSGNSLGKKTFTKEQLGTAAHDVDFDPPLYNVWKQQNKTNGSNHFGNSEVRWVDNLLYLYTQPFDMVVDPFAGGGSTIDICKKRLRRYWVSDRKPIIEREKEIRQHDLTCGLPPLPRWKDVKLVYLDPPYWAQAAGEYSDDPTDLGNMTLEDFTSYLANTITDFGKKLSAGAVIALILQPTQWNAPDRRYTDHVADMIKRVKLPIDLRIQAPYESQQCNAQMVEWAKANRKVLVLSREIVVWRVA